MQSRRSADHAQLTKGLKSTFKIPIQACEKIESSDDEQQNSITNQLR